jgi:putative ABC transport system permease protein
MTLAFAATLVAFTTLLFGLAPALELSRIDLTSALRRGGRGDVTGGRRSRGRAAIIASEVALSVVLLIGAGLMVRSLVQITRVEPGFDLDGITAFRLSLPSSRYDPEARVAFAQRYIEQLAAVPGVEDVAFMIGPPLSGISIWGGITRTDAPEPDPGEGPTANYRVAGVGALEMLGIPIVAGRSFAATDRRDSEPVVIITQRLADEVFAGVDPIGRKLDIHVTTGYEEEEPRTIVGVAADIRGSALTREPVAETFIPFAQVGAGFPHVLMRGREPAALLEAARRELRALDPELPMIRPGMMQDLVDAQLAQPRFYLILMGLFSGLAVVLAAVGIYSVVAYAVSQRTREIGVRMALGARLPQIIRLVLWQGLRPAVVGIAAGLVVAFWSGNLMRGLLYQVAPEDPLTLMVVPLLLIAVVALACSVPARRASRIPPAIALRTD